MGVGLGEGCTQKILGGGGGGEEAHGEGVANIFLLPLDLSPWFYSETDLIVTFSEIYICFFLIGGGGPKYGPWKSGGGEGVRPQTYLSRPNCPL